MWIENHACHFMTMQSLLEKTWSNRKQLPTELREQEMHFGETQVLWGQIRRSKRCLEQEEGLEGWDSRFWCSSAL